MKILQIHSSLKTGGVESLINSLSNEMSRTQEVEVCSIFKPTPNLYLWDSLNPPISKFHLGKSTPGFSLIEIWKIYRHIRKGKFDIVHLHGFMYYYYLSIFLCRKKTRFIYTVHSDAFKENTYWDRKLFKIKKYFFKKGWVRPITISKESQNSFTKLYGLESYLIPNGVPEPHLAFSKKVFIESLKPTKNTKVFIHVGRIDTPKNQKMMCECVQRLIDEGTDIMLLIAGPIVKEAIFNDIKPFFSARIKYIGEISDATEYFVFSDGLLLPSIWEGLPMTLLEAMSVGCIPICTPIGGIINVVENGKNGFLSTSISYEDYYTILKAFLNFGTDQLKIISSNAVKTVKQSYSIQTTTKNYLMYYNAVL